MQSLNYFKVLISKELGINSSHISLFWKGRVALFAILQALGIRPGDEVIIPGYTCVVVPNAIKYLGAKPVYIDIDPLSFSMDLHLLSQSITCKTRAIIVQNTLGLSPRLDDVIKISREHGLWLIEDCAHGFGGKTERGPNGLQSDAAFFSTQWNKVFSTCIGGITVAKDARLARKILEIEQASHSPSIKEEITLLVLYLAKSSLLTPQNYLFIQDCYRWLSQHDFIIGSSNKGELESTTLPERFLQRMGLVQSILGCREMKKLTQNLNHRRKIAEFYRNILQNKHFPFVPEDRNNLYLRYPLFVNNPQTLFKSARKEGIELGDWLMSPIHPILEHFEIWDYVPGSCPHSEWTAKHIINLPTHRGIDKHAMHAIRRFLLSHRHEFIPPVT